MSSIRGTSRQMVKSVSAGNVLGDVTGDGVCNISDIQKTISEIFSPGTLTQEQRNAADINKDSIVNISDIQLISTNHLRNISEPITYTDESGF